MKAIFAFILLLVTSVASAQTNRLQPSDLVYRGAFRLPAGAAAYGGDAIAFRPDGDGGQGSLIIHGHVYHAEAAEFAIPTPVVTTNISAMPQAPQLRPFADIGGNVWTKYRQSYGGSTEVNGFVYYEEQGKPTKLCWTLLNWYNVTGTNDNSFSCSNPPGQTPSPVGAAHPGLRSDPNWHSNQIGGYLFQIPSSIATRFGNAANMLCAGFHRQAGAFGGSQGPTINCFNPWNGSNLYPDGAEIPGGTNVLRYPTWKNDCWQNSSCVFPNYQAPDRWAGAQYVSAGGKEAILIAGMKGLGTSYYSSGWHADPYENRVIFYDIDELAQFAQGQRTSVVPYVHFVPPVIVPAKKDTYKTYGAMAYDSERQRLYIVDACAGPNCTPIIQVWDVAGGASPPPPPPPPSAVTATLTVSPTTVNAGENVTWSWSSTNATSCEMSVDGGAPFPVTTSGQESGPLQQSMTGVLTCTGADGQASASATVTVVQSPPPPPPPPPANPPAPTVDETVSRCRFVLTAQPPDTTGGWTAQFHRNGGTTNIGSADSSAPYTRTIELSAGSYVFGVRWTKSGVIKESDTAQAVCP